MNEIIKLIPLFGLSIIIFWTSAYFLKKDKKKETNNKSSALDFAKLMNTRTRYAKIFSIILFVIVILKIFYILFSNL